MATVSANLWSTLLGQLRRNHPQLVRGWFGELLPVGLERGVLTVKAHNRAQAGYLQCHCSRAFAEAAQLVTGQLVSAAFELDEQQEEEPTGLAGLDAPDAELALNPNYTFEQFVTGPSNRLAHAAALAVAESPGTTYNPLFLHGPVGLGKTHLAQAICHAIRAQHPGHNSYYISCETFINHFIDAVEQGSLHQFRYRYRHVDVLVIDDIQFLAKRERSQEEFFHTFNNLYQFRRQVILTADCPPVEIPSLEERLVSRFNSGLVALLDRPCLETRMAIIRKKAKLRCFDIPGPVVQLIAGRIDTNVRELEGALTKIDALSQATEQPVSLELAREALGEEPNREVGIPTILEAVAERMSVKVTDLQSKKRAQAITHPRHVCMYLARELTSQSLEQIGGYFGGRDHTTVLHGSRAIARQLESNPQLRASLDELAETIKNAR